MAAPLNPADQPYGTVLNRLFPEDNRGKDEALRTFDLILSHDVDGLRTWVSDPSEGAKRVNDVATKMLLHPLHLCAMTGSLECSKTLIDTKVCKIDPQDASGATPLHHAAVRGNHAMILCFLKSGAKQLPDRCGGSYVSILRQMQALKPEAQVVFYRDDNGDIVKGDGRDFKRLTDAIFLDKDCRISPEEWLKLWQKRAREPDLLPPSLEARYDEFSKNPPILVLEKHPAAGWNIIAGQDFKPGMVVGEYLGDVREGSGDVPMGLVSLEEMEKRSRDAEYVLEDMDATRSRGLVPMCNDSLPNTRAFGIYNKKGLPERTVFVAIHPIRKGDPVVFFYGLGHTIRFAHRVELRREAFFKYFEAECSRGFDRFVNKAIRYNDGALSQGHLPDGEANMTYQALLYIFTTPAAMLHLLTRKIIKIDEIKALFASAGILKAMKMWINATRFPVQYCQLENFYKTAFKYFDELEKLPAQDRERELERLSGVIDSTDLSGLLNLMGGDPKAYLKEVTRFQLAELFLAHREGKGDG